MSKDSKIEFKIRQFKSWTYFQVDHFSKYGLSDSDDDDNDVPLDPGMKKLKGTEPIQKLKNVDIGRKFDKKVR